MIDLLGWKKRRADRDELLGLLRLEREAAERRLAVSKSVKVEPVTGQRAKRLATRDQ